MLSDSLRPFLKSDLSPKVTQTQDEGIWELGEVHSRAHDPTLHPAPGTQRRGSELSLACADEQWQVQETAWLWAEPSAGLAWSPSFSSSSTSVSRPVHTLLYSQDQATDAAIRSDGKSWLELWPLRAQPRDQSLHWNQAIWLWACSGMVPKFDPQGPHNERCKCC